MIGAASAIACDVGAQTPQIVEVVRNRPTLVSSGLETADSDEAAYRWNVVSSPPGSEILVIPRPSGRAEVTVDSSGDYELQVSVTVGVATTRRRLVVRATNDPPVAVPDARARYASAGDVVSMDASESFDPDDHAMTFRWQLTSQPAESAASVSSDGAAAWFVPDVPGAYTVAVTVDDGEETSAPATVDVVAIHRTVPLAPEIGDAEYSHALEAIVFTDSEALHVFETETEQVRSMQVGFWLSLALSPDGRRALLGRNGEVAEVDLETLSIVGMHTIDAYCQDIALGDDRVVYAAGALSSEGITWLDLDSGETELALSVGREVDVVEVNTTIGVVYTSNTSSFGTVQRWELDSSGIPALGSTTSTPLGSCSGLRISTDGARLYRRSGDVLTSSANASLDLAHLGRLQLEAPCVVAVVDSPARDVIAAIPRDVLGDDQSSVHLFDPETLMFQDEVRLEWIDDPTDPPRTGVGEFAFFSADGSRLYVLFRGRDLWYVVRIDR